MTGGRTCSWATTPPRDVRDECDRSRELPSEASKIFLNIRGEKFRQARYFRHGSGPGARCAEVLDFNGDGWDDLFTCRDENMTPRLYRNRQGRGLVDVTARNHLTRRLTDGTVPDLDGDRDPTW